jgi:hypothetical protein
MSELKIWSYTIIFGAMAALIIGNNLWVFIQSRIKNESVSFTIFAGAIFGVLSLLTAPMPLLKWLAFIPILVDPGTSYVIYAILKKH